jgi:cyclophilin family peptidyl-prolyl cis-trans isomerase
VTNKRARERQLAKLAARRYEERRRARRRRNAVLGALGAALAVGLVVLGLRILGGDGGAATPTPSASPTPTPTGAPRVSGEVRPAVEPPSTVACGARAPSEAGAAKPQYDRAPGTDLLDPTKRYRAVIETSCGTIQVALDARRAPQAVASFVFLAREGFFDGLTFHRVVPGFVIQGGDPLGDGTGGPGYAFPDELDGRMRYEPGTLAMANSGPDTNGSQWFIVSGPEGRNLDEIPNYTIFGSVRRGMDVVRRIDAVPTDAQDRPEQAVYIVRVRIEEV